jgi:hypothetical protein
VRENVPDSDYVQILSDTDPKYFSTQEHCFLVKAIAFPAIAGSSGVYCFLEPSMIALSPPSYAPSIQVVEMLARSSNGLGGPGLTTHPILWVSELQLSRCRARCETAEISSQTQKEGTQWG